MKSLGFFIHGEFLNLSLKSKIGHTKSCSYFELLKDLSFIHISDKTWFSPQSFPYRFTDISDQITNTCP